MIPKPGRVKDRKFLDSIQGKPCVICGRPGEPHHPKTKGSGGSDLDAKPLCHIHHRQFHGWGRFTFCEKYGLDWFVRPEENIGRG